MATPTRANKKTWLGSEPVANDDEDDIGGAKTGSPINEATVGNLFGDMRISTDGDVAYYTIFYEGFNHTSSGSIENARVALRSGARFNTSAGSVTLVSTSASDTSVVRITGKVDDTWVQENITLAGTTPVSGVQEFDNSGVYRYEFVSGTPVGIITCSVNSEICAVLYGTSANPVDGGSSIATYMATTEIAIAVADAINSTLESNDRLTPPDDIGGFSQATYWTGEDNSINVPGGSLGVNDYIGVCARFTAYQGIFPPANGKLLMEHGIIGDATA